MVAAKQRTGRAISVVVPQQSQRKDLRALPVWRRPHWRVRRDLPDGLRRLVGPAGNERDVLLWLHSDLAQGEARDRFLREARVVGQLSHPNVITLHDMGIEESTQTPYLVMEYIEGLPLDRVLEKGTLPFPRACAWIAHAAEALDAAHKRGVIHGDVKPANILITSDGKVKLTDFGMARVAKRDAGDSPLLGTPAYWCTEQIIRRPQDARSDIFSLGVVLYEMVTGTRPFEADSLQGVCNRVLSSA